MIKIADDGSHQGSGKWALTRDDLHDESKTSKFDMILDIKKEDDAAAAVVAAAAAAAANGDEEKAGEGEAKPPVEVATAATFPRDSVNYRGTFRIRGQSKPYQEYIAIKFRKNKASGYNVLGEGVNEIGKFILKGTFLPMSQRSGKLLVYRFYTEFVNPAPARSPPKPPARPEPGTEPPILARKASSRTIKKPVKDVSEGPVTLDKVMKDCSSILRELTSTDQHKIFTEPVDPVALMLPTYNTVIKN